MGIKPITFNLGGDLFHPQHQVKNPSLGDGLLQSLESALLSSSRQEVGESGCLSCVLQAPDTSPFWYPLLMCWSSTGDQEMVSVRCKGPDTICQNDSIQPETIWKQMGMAVFQSDVLWAPKFVSYNSHVWWNIFLFKNFSHLRMQNPFIASMLYKNWPWARSDMDHSLVASVLDDKLLKGRSCMLVFYPLYIAPVLARYK